MAHLRFSQRPQPLGAKLQSCIRHDWSCGTKRIFWYKTPEQIAGESKIWAQKTLVELLHQGQLTAQAVWRLDAYTSDLDLWATAPHRMIQMGGNALSAVCT